MQTSDTECNCQSAVSDHTLTQRSSQDGKNVQDLWAGDFPETESAEEVLGDKIARRS